MLKCNGSKRREMILTFKEEVILSALWILGGESTGALLRKKVIDLSRKEIVYGTLYNLLEYLIKKGYVDSQKSKPTAQPGGKRKTIYRITKEGKISLKDTKLFHQKIFDNLPDLELET